MIQSLSKKSRLHYEVVDYLTTARLYLPDNPTRIIIYSGGLGEDRGSVAWDVNKWPIAQAMLKNDWAILSCTESYNWGNTAALNNYYSRLEWAEGITGVTNVDIWAQSMGGLLGVKLLLTIPKAKRFYGIYPVLNLQWMFDHWAKSNIKVAYSFSNDGDYPTATAGHDPLTFENSLFTGKKFQIYQSYADVTTNLADNGDELYDKINGVADIEIVECTGVHGDLSHFQKDNAIAFLKS